MNITTYTSHDNTELALYTWDQPKAIGVVKICHGMAEHCGRYDEFAQYLNTQGYIVVANDHRGHGRSTNSTNLGYSEGDMFVLNALDQISIVKYCQDTYNLPVILFGHSYGSFITQYIMQQECTADAYILSGSSYLSGVSIKLGGVIAKAMCRNKGGRHPAKMIADMTFGAYEKKIPGKNNWLSRDASVVAGYNGDPLCGFVCSANFYRSFMGGLAQLYKKNRYVLTPNKPLLIISGAQDPVGDYGKGITRLDNFYKTKVGLDNVTTKLYEGARHELLNETNKAEAMAYIGQWIETTVKSLD